MNRVGRIDKDTKRNLSPGKKKRSLSFELCL